MKDCKYPNCEECEFDDCQMEENDIHALLKKRRYNLNPELSRQRQRSYRSLINSTLPNCNNCPYCVLVKKEKSDGVRRLCVEEMQLIEQKVSTCPQWCKKRVPDKNYLKRRERVLAQKREKYREVRKENVGEPK